MNARSSDLVSVIVPICNVEKYLAQALESIISQTHENLEILCLNDGSTDSSLSIIKGFAEKDSRIVVVDKQNEGYGRTCNRGLEMAHGTWVSIIEPDDWINATMYEDMLDLSSRFEDEIDIIKTPWISVEEWDKPETQYERISALAGRIPTSKAPFKLADHPDLIEMHPSIWSAIYRTEFLIDNNITFPEYPGAGWADNPFLIDTLCQAEKIVFLSKGYYHYRADIPGSTKNHATADAIIRPFVRWLGMMDQLEGFGISDSGILQAHYLRGFIYVYGAISDDGWDNPLVQEYTKKVFARMDKELVLTHPKVSNSRKRFYLEQLGLEGVITSKGRSKFLFNETIHTIKNEGVGAFFRKAQRHVSQMKPPA